MSQGQAARDHSFQLLYVPFFQGDVPLEGAWVVHDTLQKVTSAGPRMYERTGVGCLGVVYRASACTAACGLGASGQWQEAPRHWLV